MNVHICSDCRKECCVSRGALTDNGKDRQHGFEQWYPLESDCCGDTIRLIPTTDPNLDWDCEIEYNNTICHRPIEFIPEDEFENYPELKEYDFDNN